MKMDTTTWILLGALLLFLIWEWQKKNAVAGSLAGGYRPGAAGATGATGTAGRSLLQQLLGGTGNTQKPSPGISASTGGGGSAGKAPTAINVGRNPWRPPALTQVPYASSVLTGLIPSIAPPVYTQPTVNYLGDPIDTIPSDTSNLFLTPDTPPAYTDYPATGIGSIGQWTDPVTGVPIDLTGGEGPILQGVSAPTYDFPTMDYPGGAGAGTTSTPDPTAFNPVDYQTIDTSTLGGISYLPDSGNVPYASGGGYTGGGGGYDENLQTSGSGGDWAANEYGFDPGYSEDTSFG